jgi:hypothetical protein
MSQRQTRPEIPVVEHNLLLDPAQIERKDEWGAHGGIAQLGHVAALGGTSRGRGAKQGCGRVFCVECERGGEHDGFSTE